MKKEVILLVLAIITLSQPAFATMIYGVVVDELENIVPYSEIKFECSNFNSEIMTDKFGSFAININKTQCIASAKKGNLIGYAEFKVENENMQKISIKLDKTIKPGNLVYWLLLIPLLIIIILFYYYRKKNKKVSASNILDTLSEKEKKIIELLKAHNGTLTQAKIRYISQIPKVTLSRQIKSLEAKKLIKTESLGKMKKIELSKVLK